MPSPIAINRLSEDTATNLVVDNLVVDYPNLRITYDSKKEYMEEPRPF